MQRIATRRNSDPDHDDQRFDEAGSPKKEWFRDDTALILAGRNSRWDPETGEFEYYADRPDEYYRDPDTGRWTKRTATDEKDDRAKNPAQDDENELRQSPELITPAPIPPLGGVPKNNRDILRWLLWGARSGVWAKDTADKLERTRERSKSGKDDDRR